jgi:hypothetical protein
MAVDPRMLSYQWLPQREQQSGPLRSPWHTVAEYADYTAVVSLGVQVFCGLALVAVDIACDVPYTPELYSQCAHVNSKIESRKAEHTPEAKFNKRLAPA